MSKIAVNCITTDCAHFKNCCQLPTEYHAVDNRIDIIFVGQGGGKDEERLKRPWIGRAGQLLRNTIRTLRQKKPLGIALSNSVRCRPTIDLENRLKDRAPTEQEINWCLPYLYRDIEQLKPVAVIAMGASSANIFGFEGPVAEMRKQLKKQMFGEHEAHVFMTYHPSGVLQSGFKYLEDFRSDILSIYKLALRARCKKKRKPSRQG